MKNRAFTLVELVIMVLVLGLVVSLVLPPVIKRHKEALKRAQIKKSMTAYDFILARMAADNELRGERAFQEWADANCHNTSQYFKVHHFSSTNTEENKYCKFMTTDKVWWDISDILSPIIAVGGDNNSNNGGNDAFRFMAHFDDNGSLRVNDLNWELSNSDSSEDKADIQKLFDFLLGKPSEPATTERKIYTYVDTSAAPTIYNYDYYIDENGNKIMVSRTEISDNDEFEWEIYEEDYFSYYDCPKGVQPSTENCTVTFSYYYKDDKKDYCKDTSENICRGRRGQARIETLACTIRNSGKKECSTREYWANGKFKKVVDTAGNPENKPKISEFNEDGNVIKSTTYYDYKNNIPSVVQIYNETTGKLASETQYNYSVNNYSRHETTYAEDGKTVTSNVIYYYNDKDMTELTSTCTRVKKTFYGYTYYEYECK